MTKQHSSNGESPEPSVWECAYQTLKSDLTKHFCSEENGSNPLCDLVLIAKDGTRFPTLRAVLCARCRFFTALLSSGFKESQQAEVSVDWTSQQLRSVLQYMFTGSFEYKKGLVVMNDTAKHLIDMRDIADYIDSQDMYDTCYRYLCDVVEEHDCYVSVMALNAICREPRKSSIPALSVCVSVLESHAEELYWEETESESNTQPATEKTFGVHLLSRKALNALFGEVKRMKKIDCNWSDRHSFQERGWFLLVSRWFHFNSQQNNNNHNTRDGDVVDVSNMHVLVDELCLEGMSYSFLKDTVVPSGLVSNKRLVKAFEFHICQAKKQHNRDKEKEEEYEGKLKYARKKAQSSQADEKGKIEDLLSFLKDLEEGPERKRLKKS